MLHLSQHPEPLQLSGHETVVETLETEYISLCLDFIKDGKNLLEPGHNTSEIYGGLYFTTEANKLEE